MYSEKNVMNTYKNLTLSEAQRTQGIESMSWIKFLTEINLK